jgi:probable aminopeptidase NPEPL1
MIQQLKNGNSVSSLLPVDKELITCTLLSLPDTVSRNNHAMSLHIISDQIGKICPKAGHVQIYTIGGTDMSHVVPCAMAIAKAFPLYSEKTSSKQVLSSPNTSSSSLPLHIDGYFLNEACQPFTTVSSPVDHTKVIQGANVASESIRYVSSLVDMPPNLLTTDFYSQECHRIVKELKSGLKKGADGDDGHGIVTIQELVGNQLLQQGDDEEKDYSLSSSASPFGGIYHVGKAAECPPRVVVMTYTPKSDSDDNDVEHVALCGKGVVYDSGGLSLKTKAGMPGMKADMVRLFYQNEFTGHHYLYLSLRPRQFSLFISLPFEHYYQLSS